MEAQVLQGVRIRKFRSCEGLGLDISRPLIALVGRNGVGKTSILRAISEAADLATRVQEKTTNTLPAALAMSVTLTFVVEGVAYRYSVEREPVRPRPNLDAAQVRVRVREALRYRAEPRGRLVPLLQRSGASGRYRVGSLTSPRATWKAFELNASASALATLLSLLPTTDPAREWLTVAHTFLQGVHYYPFDEPVEQPESVLLASSYLQWAETRPLDLKAPMSVLYRQLRLVLDRPDEMQELMSLMGTQGLGLIDAVAFTQFTFASGDARFSHGTLKAGDTIDPNAVIFPSFRLSGVSGGDQRPLNYGYLSSGTRRVLALLTALVHDRASAMLIEQPEDGIHRGLLRKVINILRTNGGNSSILLASHSTALFDVLSPQELRLVTIEAGQTRARNLSAAEIAAAEEFLSSEGSLSDFVDSIEEP